MPLQPPRGFHQCQRLAPSSTSSRSRLGGRERRGKGNPRAKNTSGKHTRLERGTRTTSNFHPAEPQQNLSGSEGKVQRPGEPGPGRGRSASHPYSAEAGDTFHHLLSEKQQSSQARRLLPGNLDYVATETTTSREPGPGKQSNGDKPRLLAGRALGARKCRAQDTTPGARREERGRRGPGRRETKRERGGFRSTSFSLPLPRAGSGLPHPPQGALLGNSWERVRRRLTLAGLS